MARPPRIELIDLIRSLAVLCMAIFHFTFDLMLFGHLPAGYVFQGFWPYFARGIASSFLFLAGLSLWLSHGQGIIWGSFWRRFAIVGFAALVVSAGTYVAMPTQFVRWGILHMIAAGSLIGLITLSFPTLLTLAIAIAAFTLPHYMRSDLFDAPGLIWVGLSTHIPPMMDYEPVLPWLCPILLGVVVGRLGSGMGLWHKLSAFRIGPQGKYLLWPGRHSLFIYLLHQPVLFGAVWVYTMVGAR